MRTKIFLGLCLLFLVSFVFVSCESGGDNVTRYTSSENVKVEFLSEIDYTYYMYRVTDGRGVVCYVITGHGGSIDCL